MITPAEFLAKCITFGVKFGAAAAGAGTVTSVSVTTSAGVSGVVANDSSTPAITLTLGDITPTSVAASGNVTGSNLSGTNTGDQTNITGNAGTVTGGVYTTDAGTVFLAPTGNGSGLTGITAAQVGAPSGSGTSSGSNTGDQDLTPYAPKASPTFTGTVTLPATGAGANEATTKSYVDNLVSSGATWRNPIADPDINDVVLVVPAVPVAGATYIAYGGTYPQNWGTGAAAVVSGDVVARKQDNSAWIVIKNLTAGDRFLMAAEHGAVSATLLTAGFFDDDLIEYVSGNPALTASWTFPQGRGQGGSPEIAQGITVLVSQTSSEHYGHTYLYDATGNAWTEIAGPGAVGAGTYLAYTGNVLNVTLVAGVDFLAPAGSGSSLTGITAAQVGAPSGSGTSTGSNTGDQTNITGNAATVTTNANLTGPVTSVGNATAIANGAISNAMLANAAVANLSGTNTGDQTNISGNAATATNATTAATATNTTITAVSTNSTFYPTFVSATSGNLPQDVDTDLTYNPSTNTLGLVNIAASGTLTSSGTTTLGGASGVQITADTGRYGSSGLRLRSSSLNAQAAVTLMPNGSGQTGLRLYNADDVTGTNLGAAELSFASLTNLQLIPLSFGSGTAPTTLSIGLNTSITGTISATGLITDTNSDNTSASKTHITLARGTGGGSTASINTTGDASNGVASMSLVVGSGVIALATTGVSVTGTLSTTSTLNINAAAWLQFAGVNTLFSSAGTGFFLQAPDTSTTPLTIRGGGGVTWGTWASTGLAITGTLSTSALLSANAGLDVTGGLKRNGTLVISDTVPTIASGFGTGANIVAVNGSFAFTVNVGTGGTATSGQITLPAAPNGWICLVNPWSSYQTNSITIQTTSSTTSVGLSNLVVSSGATLAWTASQQLHCICVPY